MATPSDKPVNDLTTRLRAAADRMGTDTAADNANAAATWEPPTGPTPPPPLPEWSAPAPTGPRTVYGPMPPSSSGGGGGGGRTAVIVAAVVGALVVVPVLAIVAITLLGRTSTGEFDEVPPTLGADAPAGTVFQPIAGYTLRAAPQADLDQVRSGIEARTPAGSLETVDGRLVYKDGKAVAEAIVTVFDADVPFDTDAALEAFAGTLASHEDITIAGSKAIYGKASNSAEVIAVYEGHTGIAVAGSGRAQLEDVASKLVPRI